MYSKNCLLIDSHGVFYSSKKNQCEVVDFFQFNFQKQLLASQQCVLLTPQCIIKLKTFNVQI